MLELEQLLLDVEAARIAGQAPARADDTVAREHDRNRIPMQGAADGAGRTRPADPACEGTVGRQPTVRDLCELGQHELLERRQDGDVRLELEGLAPALEVLVKL